MKKIFLLFFFGYSMMFGVCTVSSDCETALSNMGTEAKDFIDYSFSELENQIADTDKEYQNLNEELDKEIYVLKIRLEAEKLLAKKLSNIEVLVKKSVELKNLDTSVLYNIIENTSIIENSILDPNSKTKINTKVKTDE